MKEDRLSIIDYDYALELSGFNEMIEPFLITEITEEGEDVWR